MGSTSYRTICFVYKDGKLLRYASLTKHDLVFKHFGLLPSGYTEISCHEAVLNRYPNIAIGNIEFGELLITTKGLNKQIVSEAIEALQKQHFTFSKVCYSYTTIEGKPGTCEDDILMNLDEFKEWLNAKD